jgi:iron complex transport system substrate-binding protein
MHRDELLAVGAGELIAVDAASYFSRPGPRIVDGLELLAWLIHPELVDDPGAVDKASGSATPPRALTVEF